jgi:DNA-binding MarR family transcriptional regulator
VFLTMRRDDQTALRLGLLIQELMGLVHRRFAGDTMAIMVEAGVTLPQIVALHVLRFTGPQSIGGLVEHLKLSVSATSHLVDRLFDKGFVDRREDEADRRQKRVEITAAGIALLDDIARERTAEFSRALGSLDPELRAQLIAVFERAIQELRCPES